MAGTISLIGADREVLHTIYLGDGPEYGKSTFNAMMATEIQLIQSQFGHLPWSGVADGAAHDWTFLADYVETQIIDRSGGPLLSCLGIYLWGISSNIPTSKNAQKEG